MPKTSRSDHVQAATLTLQGEQVPYTVRRSRRAKHLRIRILPTGVEVVLPMRAHAGDAQTFLQDNASWVLRHLRLLRQKGWLREGAPDERIRALLLRGQEMRVDVRSAPASATRAYVQPVGDVITLHLPAGKEALARPVLERWLRQLAGAEISARVSIRSAQMGLSPKRLFIRDQRSKWGNCSSLGNLSLNWRLIGAPPEVLDYVVVHELAHLQEMNHSPRFWALVQSFCPGYAQHKAWLKTNGGRLMLDL
jgi:predicted metal-dependent hydrolase